MFGFNKDKKLQQAIKSDVQPKEDLDQKLTKSLKNNIILFKSLFSGDDTVIYRFLENQHETKVKCVAIFINGMINDEIVDKNIIWPIVKDQNFGEQSNILDYIEKSVVLADTVERCDDVAKLCDSMVYGDTILLVDGYDEALILSSKGWQWRGIEEPENEKNITGSREGFNESILVNLTMIRRRIKTPDLKINFRTFGTRTNTKIAICYLDSLVDKSILEELNRRLDKVNIDGILDSNYLVELIRDEQMTPFKTIGSTERPDTVVAKLLEGRIAIVVDGTPKVITLPYLFIEYFQMNDDYYSNFYLGSFLRLLRLSAFVFTTIMPALYLALLTFHQEILPVSLLLNIARARMSVPFPTILELLIQIFIFEMLTEANTRMPGGIGQALSIVGALVLGQAAVDAKFFSAPMIIIIAFTSITTLILPRMRSPIIMVRIFLIVLAAIIGIYGIATGLILILLHMLSIRSFGVKYTDEFSLIPKKLQDSFFRLPWRNIVYRPERISGRDIVRNATGDVTK